MAYTYSALTTSIELPIDCQYKKYDILVPKDPTKLRDKYVLIDYTKNTIESTGECYYRYELADISATDKSVRSVPNLDNYVKIGSVYRDKLCQEYIKFDNELEVLKSMRNRESLNRLSINISYLDTAIEYMSKFIDSIKSKM